MIDRDKTPNFILKEVKKIKLKDYDLIKKKENFFIWKKKDKKDYIRLCLIEKGFSEVFYWNLELSFKPFCYKHNHRKNSNIKSKEFKVNQNKLYFKYFLEMINKIKKESE